jgi:cytochrome c biogenesis protein CcmG/thiol:disulfide interchange protein DsbE
VASVGDEAPDFELNTLDGETIRLSDLRGTPVVLNFWASWCTPCRAEFPLLRNAHRSADGEFAVVGVDTGDIRGDGRQFARDQRADWPNGFDVDGAVARSYGVIGLPQTFFIRADGTIAARVPAELSEDTIREQLATITSS